MKAELLPCPFCGARLEISEKLSNRRATAFVHISADAPCVMDARIVWSDDHIAAWNTRDPHLFRAGQEDMRRRAEARGLAWTKPDALKLAAGEMTAQELRTAVAVAKGIASAIAALPILDKAGE